MAGKGTVTGCDLSDTMGLCMPWQLIGGQLQPPFSQAAALLSLELASSAYDLQLDAWRQAGWHDISYQVDNLLFSGVVGGRNQREPEEDVDRYQKKAQAHLKRLNPISQLRGVLRQRESSDTCKAVVMVHAAPGNRYVVAIGFMGTGKRLYDWISNFRMSQTDGVHTGFLQLTQRFEKNLTQILFPETARELGLNSLTLADVFSECRRPDSRFLVWMAGHSQGGAVMQLTAYREIGRGMLRQNLLGYGFASPSVLYRRPEGDPAGFPLFHIINADDVVPRIGAEFHLGRCRVFTADDEMRRACYGDALSSPAFLSVLHLMHSVRDNEGAMLVFLALLRALTELPGEDAAQVLNSLIGGMVPGFLVGMLGGRMDDVLSRLIRFTEQGFASAMGDRTVSDRAAGLFAARIGSLIRSYGASAFSRAVGQALGLPHRLRVIHHPAKGMGAYQYLVTRRFDGLTGRIYCASAQTGVGTRSAVRRLPVSRYAAFTAQRARRARRAAGRA